MLELIRIKKKLFYITMVSVALIILTISVDTLIKANNEVSFNIWQAENSLETLEEVEQYRVYLGILMVDYFFRLIVPMVYGLQTYFAYKKSGVGIIYKSIWSVILIAMLIVTILNFNTASLADYLTGISYIVIIITLLNIKKDSKKILEVD